jgi:4-amino-4-deoxy-L-arabinose transferase-like glycosyltransferase
MKKFFTDKKVQVAIILILIIVAAFAVRFYKFHDWLYFKMDQARDVSMTSNALRNGPEYLPLLGPRAGATKVSHGYLRLGPAFYYFQYIAGKIFNSSSPDVLAYPDLFFSIAVLPLLYLLLRIYFSRKISFLVLVMYAFSFLVIQYSRFAWNPNSLPFFAILSFYGLLKFLNDPDQKKRRWWIALWTLGLLVGSQLHFFGFFSLVGISGLLVAVHYEIWKKENIKRIFTKNVLKKSLPYIGAVILVFAITYSPVIISDVMRKGENSQNFFEAIRNKPSDKPLKEKIAKNFQEQLDYYCLVASSECYKGTFKNHKIPAIFTGILFLAGFLVLVAGLRKKRSQKEKDFLWLVLIWFGVFFVACIPVAFQLRPRFFILVFPIPFILVGLIYEFLEEKFRIIGQIIAWILVLAVLFLNFRGTYLWFKEQTDAQVKKIQAERTLILKVKDGVTLGQLERVTDFIYQNKKANANIYFYVKPEHVAPIKHLLFRKDPKMIVQPLKINEDPNAQYFAITPVHRKLEPVTKKFSDTFTVKQSEKVGQLMVSEIEFTSRPISTEFRFNKSRGKSDRVYWKDIFGIKENPENIIEADSYE